MIQSITDVLFSIFIFVFVFSIFILACLFIVKTMNGSIEMFIESPIAFIFYTFVIFIFGYGIYNILSLSNKNKIGKTE